MILIHLIGAVTVILFLKFYLYKRRIMKYVGHLPSPPEVPVVAAGLYFLGKNSVEMMEMLSMTIGMFDTPCRWLGPMLAIFLGKPEDFQTVLLSPKCLDKPNAYQFMENIGLFSGPSYQAKLVANRIIKFWLHPNFIYKWTQGYRDFQENVKHIFEIPREIRKIKEKEFYGSNHFENTEDLKENEFYNTPQIFVNELFKLHHQKLLDDRMLDDQILTILVGGHETTALTTSHVLLMLAKHPEIQERAYQEIKDAHESQTSLTDAEIMGKLDYLEMCIKEAMRLFPFAPFIGRKNSDDITLSFKLSEHLFDLDE